jgi:hypothetical protein
MVIGVDLSDVPGYATLEAAWTEGLAGVQLTSVGSIVGALAYNNLAGKDVALPHWE